MKTFISALTVLFLMLATPMTALAGGDHHNPPPPTPPAPAPTPVIDDTLTVAVLGFVGGEGKVNWSGAEGFGAVQKTSVLDMTTNIAYRKNTDLSVDCPGGCDDNVVTIGLHAQENILTEGGAINTNPGEAVIVTNSSVIQSLFNLNVNNLPAPPAAPAPSDGGGSE